MDRVYNFSSGPSMLPAEVIEKLAENFKNYNGTGMSVMEINKKSKEYNEIYSSAEALLRELLGIPQNYKVFFMNGSSAVQYSAIPLNLLSDHKCADYIISGRLSKNASLEAKRYGDIALAASSAGATPAFSTVPETERKHFRPDADYVHICFNNTVYGTKFHYVPDTGNIPLVADMSSFLLSEPIETSKFALIYANAECGIGISGLTVLIIRDDLMGGATSDVPLLLDYKRISDGDADFQLAPIWSIYVAKLVFEWIKSIGGLLEIKRRNERKASVIYDYLDSQTYYTAPVDKKCRSMMNVVFVTGDAALDKKFAEEAKAEGLENLGGDSSVGGMCASIYNAMPMEGVEKLVVFMKKFAQENPKLEA
ncbi:MAG: 3-phosphoserine/phosphohydroxythreonine transaminase [Ruminococcaceae bacterium]|nr:3-phosphoserine/phosphohydroxythreonine transaminase [Oscillospiraceae bacterium]